MRGDSDDPDELELFMAEIGANAAGESPRHEQA